jgi:hypothetical protein
VLLSLVKSHLTAGMCVKRLAGPFVAADPIRSLPRRLAITTTTNAVMATNILSVPFKRTRAVPLLERLTSFISSALDQHPEQFKDDLAALDKLRADIVVMDVHTGTLERLIAYHAQLLALAAKLPVDVLP